MHKKIWEIDRHRLMDFTFSFFLLFHTSTLEARNTQVGAISTGSILLREYLQTTKNELYNIRGTLNANAINTM